MANCSRGRGRTIRPAESQSSPASTPSEPVMRRWPHPVEGAEIAPEADADLYYIRCALSYQNQLLADIKALLQQLATLCENTAAEEP